MTIHAKVSTPVRDFITRHHDLLVGGRTVPPVAGERINVLDPGTGATMTTVAQGRAADVDKAVRSAHAAFHDSSWRDMKPVVRSRLLHRLADLIERDMDFLAELETVDNGAPLLLTRHFFLPLVAATIRYYAGWPTQLHGDSLTLSAPGEWHAYTLREPIGVVGQIVAWNVPLVLAMQKVAPALAAGCTVVLKPSELTPLTALRLGELALEAGIPDGVLNIVTGAGDAGAALVAHPLVDKISFTGSTAVGKSIMRSAAEGMKRLSLELGGKSPAIVFADADLELAIPGAANAVFMNTGQVCVAGSRLFVHRKVYDKVVEGVAAIASQLPIGYGLDEGSVIGPLISAAQRERVLGYVEQGRAAGASVVVGGGAAGDGGFFVKPTLFTHTSPDMSIVREEIFGPVVAAIPFDDDTDMASLVAMANDTHYGLAASIWTRDLATAHRMARRVRSGTVGINSHGLLDVALPFGGTKQSGFGREYGAEGVLAYTELKSVAALLHP